MRCRRVQPHLLDFSTGRLEAGTAGAVQAHLERCADCRRVLRREQRMATLLGAITRVAPRTDAWTSVEAAIGSAPSRRRWKRWQPMAWTGGLAAAAALTISLITPTIQTPVTPTEPDPLRAFTPSVAAGLTSDRTHDPLVVLQKKLDRVLDQLADERS
jgi:predicted anti-sigma-YlaC factor YlaD